MDIKQVANQIGLDEKDLICYGNQIAKVDLENTGNKNGKLILVTAMTSNKTGIGKTTISIGLADALKSLGNSTILTLRQPSMGPVFGIKGGATGGGKSRVEPSDEINLHFTGDFHAITQANNLLASIIDNHIFQGNQLDIDENRILFKRCLDLNERSLRNYSYKIGDKTVNSGFVITAASEVMAIMSLSKSLSNLKENLGNIMVALNKNGQPIYARDLHAQDAMTILLKDAFKPNLVATKEGTPTLVHLGPFANIAHGCNSLIATQFALTHADYCVTEAGFGSDLGGEKFLDIKSRLLEKSPDACVLVVVCKVVKEHGNGNLTKGFENVKRHIDNLKNLFKLNLVVAINKHDDDCEEDILLLKQLCEEQNVEVSISNGFALGSKGCTDLAKKVLSLCQQPSIIEYAYALEESIKDKIEKIAINIYGASSVKYTPQAEQKIKLAQDFGCEKFFVNIAKTQFSFSDDKNLLGMPTDFSLTITDIEIRSGAKMIVAIAGNMLLMPGLGKTSNYESMQIDTATNKITGLF